MVFLAFVVPPLLQVVSMIGSHGSSMLISGWFNHYGVIVVVGELAIGSIFLFRALRFRYALLSLLLYVPLTVLLIQGVGLFVAGAVFNDYL